MIRGWRLSKQGRWLRHQYLVLFSPTARLTRETNQKHVFFVFEIPKISLDGENVLRIPAAMEFGLLKRTLSILEILRSQWTVLDHFLSLDAPYVFITKRLVRKINTVSLRFAGKIRICNKKITIKYQLFPDPCPVLTKYSELKVDTISRLVDFIYLSLALLLFPWCRSPVCLD